LGIDIGLPGHLRLCRNHVMVPTRPCDPGGARNRCDPSRYGDQGSRLTGVRSRGTQRRMTQISLCVHRSTRAIHLDVPGIKRVERAQSFLPGNTRQGGGLIRRERSAVRIDVRGRARRMERILRPRHYRTRRRPPLSEEFLLPFLTPIPLDQVQSHPMLGPHPVDDPLKSRHEVASESAGSARIECDGIRLLDVQALTGISVD